MHYLTEHVEIKMGIFKTRVSVKFFMAIELIYFDSILNSMENYKTFVLNAFSVKTYNVNERLKFY